MGLEAYRHVAGVGGVVQHRLVVLVGVTQQAFAAVLYSSIPHTHTHTHTHTHSYTWNTQKFRVSEILELLTLISF